MSVCDPTRQTSVETRTTRNDTAVQLTNVTTAYTPAPSAQKRFELTTDAPQSGVNVANGYGILYSSLAAVNDVNDGEVCGKFAFQR